MGKPTVLLHKDKTYISSGLAAKDLGVSISTVTHLLADEKCSAALGFEVFIDPASHRRLVSEESVKHLAARRAETTRPIGKTSNNAWTRRAQKIVDGECFIRVSEGARYLGIHQTTLHGWAKAGHTPLGFDLKIVRDERNCPFISEDSLRALKQIKQEMPPKSNPQRPRLKARSGQAHGQSSDSPMTPVLP